MTPQRRTPPTAYELLLTTSRYLLVVTWCALVVFDLIWTATGHDRLAAYGTLMSTLVAGTAVVLSCWIRRTLLDGQAALAERHEEMHRGVAELKAHLDARLDKLEETQPIAVYRSPVVGVAAVHERQPRRRRSRATSRPAESVPDNVRAFELGRRAGREGKP